MNKEYRQAIGERLKSFRLERGLSAYKVAKQGGIAVGQVAIVEDGDTNYTIDTFFGYIRGCDLYMYFAEKSEARDLTHDFDDLAQKGIENYPE